MILYLDASALVKLYVTEPGSTETSAVTALTRVIGTSIISRAEVIATLAKLVRMNSVTPDEALASRQAFYQDWLKLISLGANETVVACADNFAWDYGLRGYDAVHLATAFVWQETLNEEVMLATFDRDLWEAAGHVGLIPYPDDLPALIQSWKA